MGMYVLSAILANLSTISFSTSKRSSLVGKTNDLGRGLPINVLRIGRRS